MGARVISQTIDLNRQVSTDDVETLSNREISKYITSIDSNNGIQVHAQNNSSLNYTQIDANGLEIFKTDGESTASAISVAKFGESVRIGAEDNTHFELDVNGIRGINNREEVVMDIALSDVEVPTTKVYNINYQFYVSNPTPQVITELIGNINTGEIFWLQYGTVSSDFTYGTAESKTVTILTNSITMHYDGVNSIYFTSNVSLPTAITVSTLRIETYKYEPSWSFGNREGTKGGFSTTMGNGNIASGNYSIADGNGTEASGDSAHSSGIRTIAQGPAQTAIGKFNVADTTSLFIVGNGTSNSNRSNAFSVDWNGNVNIASGANYKINGSNLSALDVSAIPTSDKQSYSSASSLSWNSLTAEQKAMIPTIQGLAFWNGAYDGSLSNLKYSANGSIIGTGNLSSSGNNHTYSISANSVKSLSFTITRAGYYPVCIDRINLGGTGSDKICLNKYGITARSNGSVTYEVAYYNPTATAYTNITVAVYVLWAKI